MTAVYRVRQGLRALLAFTQPLDLTLAEVYLSPAERRLFRQMRHSEQLHSLRVLAAVLAQGETPRPLAVAALLHDVGKARYRLMIWQKTLAVLVHRFAPGLFRRWSAGSGAAFWTRPFVVREQHPAWGAQLLEQAGASEAAAWLVAHHQDDAQRWSDHPYHAWLQRLQAADDRN